MPAEVAPGDQVTVRVAGQPATAATDQLVYLVWPNPVVFGVVQHREQDVDMRKRIGQPQGAGQFQIEVGGWTPGVVRPGFGLSAFNLPP